MWKIQGEWSISSQREQHVLLEAKLKTICSSKNMFYTESLACAMYLSNVPGTQMQNTFPNSLPESPTFKPKLQTTYSSTF